jgi:glycine cleavage system transcriptional repressor
MKQQHLVITCVGADRPGLVDELTQTILDAKGNIIDSRMTVLGEDFATITLVSGNWDAIAKLEDALKVLAKKDELNITTRRTEKRKPKADAMPYTVDVISVDAPGLLHNLAQFFASRSINIEDLSTSSYSAAHTGTPMFAMHMTVAIPASVNISVLREEFFTYCDELNMDAVLEPLKL